MDLDDALLLQRQAARISELENWIALLVVVYGTQNGDGFQLRMNADVAMTLRSALGPQPVVAIEYDIMTDRHVIDVL